MIFYCGLLLLRSSYLEEGSWSNPAAHLCTPHHDPLGVESSTCCYVGQRLRGDSRPCGNTARMALWPAASCPEMARAASMMGSTCAATCVPVIRALIPANGPNLFRKQGYPAHAGCYCARLARLHAIFSEPTTVIRHCWQLAEEDGGV